MVLPLKRWKSRTPPGSAFRAETHSHCQTSNVCVPRFATGAGRCFSHWLLTLRIVCPLLGEMVVAGWSSPVARQAHNLKVAGSNPAPATIRPRSKPAHPAGFFAFRAWRRGHGACCAIRGVVAARGGRCHCSIIIRVLQTATFGNSGRTG